MSLFVRVLVGTGPISDKLMWIYEYPLRRIMMFEAPKPTVSFRIGDATLGPYTVTPEQFPGLPKEPVPRILFHVGTAKIGDQQVVGEEVAAPPRPLKQETYNGIKFIQPAPFGICRPHVAGRLPDGL